MQRDIKFRVYNLRDNKMHYDITGFEFCNGDMTGVFIDGVFFLKEEVFIMQYTGLKDKTGKEIYEGDIVEYDDYLWTIEYSKEDGAFTLNSYDILENFINTDAKWVEVIGNIYENPNLLQEEN